MDAETAGYSSQTLARVVPGELCSGCGACAGLAPEAVEMRVSEAGFLRPVETGPVPAAAEAAIAAACPGREVRQQRPEGRRDDPLWGPYLEMRTGHATDPELRYSGSSGGALSALLMHLLETGSVDAVIETGADPARPLGNRPLRARTRAEILAGAGSRYAPSAPLADLSALLGDERRFAFVGKPCDVSALRALERRDPRVAARFPYMISFFCAGVPSLAGAREILRGLGVEEGEVAAFRYRGEGWPGHAKARLHDGREARMSYADSWGGILSRHVQLRCRICPDGTGGAADVVCADAWETDARGYPVFEERDGVSLVVSRTQRGEALVRAAGSAGALALGPFDPAELAAIQPGQTGKRRYTLARTLGLRLLGRPAPRYRGFHLGRNALRAGPVANLRNLLGTMRRVVLRSRRARAGVRGGADRG